MPYTSPNQRTVLIHRERASRDFLGIKNENWQLASRLLGPYGLQLYLYFASNADNYRLALSPAAIRDAIGMAKSTYQDHFSDLVRLGYLVQKGNTSYEFFERPQSIATQPCNLTTDDGIASENGTADKIANPSDDQENPQENIEINTKQSSPDNKDKYVQEEGSKKEEDGPVQEKKEIDWQKKRKEFVF